MMNTVDLIKALANDHRLEILNWLRDPRAHFPPQTDGDLVRDGVCGLFIAQKMRVTPADRERASAHPVAGRMVRAKRIKQWTFYKRDEKRIAEIKRVLTSAW
jgi:ArsR family transcriptional regulator